MSVSDSEDSNTTIQHNAALGTAPIQMVNRVSVKVPPFWHENPTIWFAQVEAQFEIAGMTVDSSRFNTVVAAIESKILCQVMDAVTQPPTSGKYDNLKEKLLTRFGASEQENIRKLLTDISLGDRKPSQLLNEMRSLAKNAITEQVLLTLWQNRLPTNVQAILQVSSESLEKKASLADKIMEVSSNNIAQVSTNSDLVKELQELRLQVQQLSFQRQDGRRSKSRSRSKSQHRRNSTPGKKDQSLCYYHNRFGEKARKCTQPCASAPKN